MIRQALVLALLISAIVALGYLALNLPYWIWG